MSSAAPPCWCVSCSSTLVCQRQLRAAAGSVGPATTRANLPRLARAAAEMGGREGGGAGSVWPALQRASCYGLARAAPSPSSNPHPRAARSWGNETSVDASIATFLPMIFGVGDTQRTVPGGAALILGFNEPDNAHQSDATVAEALAGWPAVAKKAGRAAAPAMAGNPVTGAWLPAFMAQAEPAPNVVPLHWYKGTNASR